MEDLRKFDPLSANCIESSIEGIILAIERDLTEDEKMIAYSMFLSGLIFEKFNQVQESLTFSKISLN